MIGRNAVSAAQGCIGLDVSQRRIARHLWKETSSALQKLERDRADILSRMGSWPLHEDCQLAQQASACQIASHTTALLEQVAELTQNVQLQVEWVQRASRKLVWQVLSPDQMAQLTCFTWPIVPDLLHVLRILV